MLLRNFVSSENGIHSVRPAEERAAKQLDSASPIEDDTHRRQQPNVLSRAAVIEFVRDGSRDLTEKLSDKAFVRKMEQRVDRANDYLFSFLEIEGVELLTLRRLLVESACRESLASERYASLDRAASPD